MRLLWICPSVNKRRPPVELFWAEWGVAWPYCIKVSTEVSIRFHHISYESNKVGSKTEFNLKLSNPLIFAARVLLKKAGLPKLVWLMVKHEINFWNSTTFRQISNRNAHVLHSNCQYRMPKNNYESLNLFSNSNKEFADLVFWILYIQSLRIKLLLNCYNLEIQMTTLE